MLPNFLEIPLVELPGSGSFLAAWPVRVQDFHLFVQETEHAATVGMLTLGPEDIDWSDRGHYWRHPGFAQTGDHPVVGVNFHDAQAFCDWLTRKEKDAGSLPTGFAYQLPTDRAWSQAMGLDHEKGESPEERLYHQTGAYPWGSSWPPPPLFGNYAGEESRENMPSWWGVAPGGYRDPYPRTSPVGSFAANPFGFYDLSGNVWEWCEDAFCPGSLSGIVRGGSWGSDRPAYLLSAQRLPKFRDTRSDEIGFRVALTRDGNSD